MKFLKNWHIKDWLLLLIPIVGNFFPLTLFSIQQNIQAEREFVIFLFAVFCLLLMIVIFTAICSHFHTQPLVLFLVYSISLIVTVTIYVGLINALIVWSIFSLLYLALLGIAKLIHKRSQQ